MFRHFTRVMEMYIIEEYKNIYPELSGSPLTDALILDCVRQYGEEADKVVRTDKGKPVVTLHGKPIPVHVSVSHSGDCFVCVVDDSPIGVDIQHGRKAAMKKIAARYFTEEEQQWVKEKEADGFFMLWTRKEAYSKYTGKGMAEIMTGASVLDRSDVTFLDFKLEDGLYGACCMASCNEKGR